MSVTATCSNSTANQLAQLSVCRAMATLADVLTELIDVVAVLQQPSLSGPVKATLVQSLCQKISRIAAFDVGTSRKLFDAVKAAEMASEHKAPLDAAIEKRLMDGMTKTVKSIVVPQALLNVCDYLTNGDWVELEAPSAYPATMMQTICRRFARLNMRSCSEQTVKYAITVVLYMVKQRTSSWPLYAQLHDWVIHFKKEFEIHAKSVDASLPFPARFPASPHQLPEALFKKAYLDADPPISRVVVQLESLSSHIPLRANSALLLRERVGRVQLESADRRTSRDPIPDLAIYPQRRRPMQMFGDVAACGHASGGHHQNLRIEDQQMPMDMVGGVAGGVAGADGDVGAIVPLHPPLQAAALRFAPAPALMDEHVPAPDAPGADDVEDVEEAAFQALKAKKAKKKPSAAAASDDEDDDDESDDAPMKPAPKVGKAVSIMKKPAGKAMKPAPKGGKAVSIMKKPAGKAMKPGKASSFCPSGNKLPAGWTCELRKLKSGRQYAAFANAAYPALLYSYASVMAVGKI